MAFDRGDNAEVMAQALIALSFINPDPFDDDRMAGVPVHPLAERDIAVVLVAYMNALHKLFWRESEEAGDGPWTFEIETIPGATPTPDQEALGLTIARLITTGANDDEDTFQAVLGAVPDRLTRPLVVELLSVMRATLTRIVEAQSDRGEKTWRTTLSLVLPKVAHLWGGA